MGNIEFMLNAKELAENVLADIMGDKPVADILLKMKIFASVRKDEELLTWVSKELGGYDEEAPPRYRILTSGLKVKIFVPFQGERWIEFPAEMIQEENIGERLSNIPFHQPIAEVEKLCQDSDDDGMIKVRVPVFAFSYFSKFIRGDVQDAYQYSTTAAVFQIVVAVKSVLIDFLLKVSNEEDINFNMFIKTNPNMSNITINAGIMNTGSGTVNAQGATNVVGDNNSISAENKADLLRILAEIDKLAAADGSNQDYEETAKDIKEELEKEQPNKKLLKKCFQAIPAFFTSVASSVAGNGLTSLISSAIALL